MQILLLYPVKCFPVRGDLGDLVIWPSQITIIYIGTTCGNRQIIICQLEKKRKENFWIFKVSLITGTNHFEFATRPESCKFEILLVQVALWVEINESHLSPQPLKKKLWNVCVPLVLYKQHCFIYSHKEQNGQMVAFEYIRQKLRMLVRMYVLKKKNEGTLDLYECMNPFNGID